MYWALHFVSLLYKGMAVIVAFASIIVFIISLVGGSAATMAIPGLGIAANCLGFAQLIAGAVISISFFAGGQYITLMIDIEENTRKTNALLQMQLQRTDNTLYLPASNQIQPYGIYNKPINGMWDR